MDQRFLQSMRTGSLSSILWWVFLFGWICSYFLQFLLLFWELLLRGMPMNQGPFWQLHFPPISSVKINLQRQQCSELMWVQSLGFVEVNECHGFNFLRSDPKTILCMCISVTSLSANIPTNHQSSLVRICLKVLCSWSLNISLNTDFHLCRQIVLCFTCVLDCKKPNSLNLWKQEVIIGA